MKYFVGGTVGIFMVLTIAPSSVYAHARTPRIYHVPILMYHEVTPIDPLMSPNKVRFSIAPTVFTEEMRYLHTHHFHTLFMHEFVTAMRRNVPLPHRTVVLTFDDGTEDFPDAVLPTLKTYNLKATAFVNPAFDGTDGRMSYNQLVAVAKSGFVEIGSHTLIHANLSTLDDQNVQEQINLSRQVLASLVHESIVSFAYPFGAYNDRVEQFVQYGGHESAVTATNDTQESMQTVFALPRITIGSTETVRDFIRIVNHW